MAEENRQLRRKNKMHDNILNIAAKLITEKGSHAVTLDEISKEADIARKTLYNHFENKEALIKELVLPVCQHAMEYLDLTKNKEIITLDDIWTYCLDLYNRKDLNVKLLYHVNVLDFSEIRDSKHGFIIVFTKLLYRINEFSASSIEELNLYAEIIYTSYLPLIECLVTHPNYEDRFKKAMTGLIQGIMV